MLLAPLACISFSLLSYLIIPPEPRDVVILGVDARPGERFLTRTDSIMVMNVTPGRFDVNLLSIPRDVFVWVPGYGEQRINTINVLGEQQAEGYGPALVKASLEESFGITVENYIRLDFNGFVALIDAVGGVDIDVPKQIIDYEYPTPGGGTMVIQFDAGKQHMDGETALQYARTRHADDDYQRAARQQQVLDALVRKLSDPRQVVNWPRVWRAIDEHADTDLNVIDWIQIGPALLLGWTGRDQRVLDRDDLVSSQAGYAAPNYDQLQPWIDQHFD
jgi:LCP family protein required for cell wall assembly